MDEEFDTSLDTSSFDDITPDTSDIGSFDEANDIVSVMDEAIDTNSFDTTENSDILPDTSDDMGSLMDEVSLDTDSIEELDIEESSLENGPEIESLMDDTDVGSDEIGASEVSNTSESDFSEVLLEQSEVNEESADFSIDVDTETSDISDSDITEISEQESDEISDLMNETTLEDMPEETEIQDESEAFDMPHDEISESANDISEIESIMSETEPALEESNDTVMSDGETYDIPHDDEVSENTDDVDDDSEIADLMDSEDFSAETEQEINSEQPDIEEFLNDTGEPDASDIVTESATDIPSESETSSFDSLYEYMSAHNYGREDFEIYSKDPEWQELNNAYRIEHGEEPIDYGQSDNNEFVEDMHDQVTEGWGIPEDSPEYDAIMENEQEISNINSQETMEIDENTDVVPEVGEQTEIQEIAPIEKIDEWLKEINPNYDAFDVESPYCNNCGSCAYSVYRRLEGETGVVASAENIGYNSEMEALTGMEQVSMSPADIEQRLLEQGAGSHAIIGIDRAEGPGHWFNAANIDGKVVAIDGQDGSISDWPPDYGDVVNWEMSIRKEA